MILYHDYYSTYSVLGFYQLTRYNYFSMALYNHYNSIYILILFNPVDGVIHLSAPLLANWLHPILSCCMCV